MKRASDKSAGPYMTRPTGNTAPPKIFTRPGLSLFICGDPPWMISKSKPPVERKAPARTAWREKMQLSSDNRARAGKDHSTLKNTLSYRVWCFTTPCSIIAMATSRGGRVLGVLMLRDPGPYAALKEAGVRRGEDGLLIWTWHAPCVL